MLDRLTQQVVGFETDSQWLEHPLATTDARACAAHMLERYEASTGPQHPRCFSHRGPIIRNSAQGQRARHSVERLIGELERLSVAKAKIGIEPQPAGALARDLQHGGT